MEPNVKIIANTQFLLNMRDFLRGALLSVITSVLTTVYTSFQGGEFKIDWKAMGQVAAVTFLGYLLKNWLEPSNTLIQVKQPSANKTVEGDIPAPAQIVVDMKPGEKAKVTTSVG